MQTDDTRELADELERIATTRKLGLLLAEAATLRKAAAALRHQPERETPESAGHKDDCPLFGTPLNISSCACHPIEREAPVEELRDTGGLVGKLLDLADYFEPNDLTASTLIREAATALAAREAEVARLKAQASSAMDAAMAGARDEYQALYDQKCAVHSAEIARLERVVVEIAGQKLPGEMTPDEYASTSYEDGYVGCVECARAALQETPK